ncbi:MAG: YajG family lipoprotein [Motiliproteus sp.]
MPKASTAKVSIVLTTLLLILSGCAQSPQQINLNPQVRVNSHVSNQPNVHLSVVDKRASQSLGTRGGTYSDSNHITLASDLQSMLLPTANQALTQMGILIDQPSPMPTVLQIWVEKLRYEVNDDQPLPMKVTLQVQIAAVANKGSQQQIARYESSKVHTFLSPPSTAKNEEIINEIFSATLTRLFNDPKLVAMIE